jgi:hypothetical protein
VLVAGLCGVPIGGNAAWVVLCAGRTREWAEPFSRKRCTTQPDEARGIRYLLILLYDIRST